MCVIIEDIVRFVAGRHYWLKMWYLDVLFLRQELSKYRGGIVFQLDDPKF